MLFLAPGFSHLIALKNKTAPEPIFWGSGAT